MTCITCRTKGIDRHGRRGGESVVFDIRATPRCSPQFVFYISLCLSFFYVDMQAQYKFFMQAQYKDMQTQYKSYAYFLV